MAVDMDKLHEFLGRFVTDLGATFAAGNVVTGHHLGLYRALAASPARTAELAERTGTNHRYVAEWLRGQAVGGYVKYDPVSDTYSMTEEQAFALADPDGGVYIPGAFVLALGTLKAEPRITEAFRTGAGMGWHEHDQNVFTGCEQFFRPGYIANLIPSWIPALDDVQHKLRAGAKVADVGCGLGASTILLAREYPNSRFAGSDYHDQSIEIARKRAAGAGVADRISFEVASAAGFSGTGYDLAATFDCLHDMGDPVAAAGHIRQALKPDGTWLVVEPYAG
jgi:Methyltransferase domain